MQEAKRGDKVSLVIKNRPFYFQEGEFGINMSVSGEASAIIPDKASDLQLAQINHDIKIGHLTIGSTYNEPAKISVKEIDLAAVLAQGRNKISEWIFDIRDNKTLKAGEKTVQLEKLIKLEAAGKNRSSVKEIAETALGVVGGVSIVTEEVVEKVEIKLTSGNAEFDSAVK